jgi:hypothetical protein
MAILQGDLVICCSQVMFIGGITMKRMLLLAVIIFVLTGPVVSAQEEIQCPAADVEVAIATALDTLTAAQGQDATTQYAAAVQARSTLAALDSACLGLDFEGSDATVTDPVYVPAGIYRVAATTEGYMTVLPTILEGDCGSDFYFILSAGEATEGAQAVFQSEGCSLIWEVSNVTEPFEVTFEKIK